MTDPVAQALQDHAHALRELARALVGGSDADDVTQAAAAAALGWRRPVREPLAFVRHLLRVQAARHHRAAARRRQRERVAAAAAPQDAPPAEHALEQRETVERLHRALLAVPQPHLGALLLRYFEALPPPAIAARLAVPLPTVKSRLRRGLELLRARLDADGAHAADGRGWREPLCRAFALPVPAATAAPSLPVLTTLLTMKATVSLLALAAAVLLAFWAWPSPAAVPVADGGVTAVADAAGTTGAASASAERHADTVAAPDARTAGAVVPAAPARVVGRVVSGDTPLAGATIDVVPDVASGSPVASVITGTDGTFACELAATGAHHVRAAAAGHVGIRTPPRELTAGVVVDLGTIPMQRGVVVKGHVVDREDRPIAGTQVAVSSDSRPAAHDWWWSDLVVRSGDDGRFQFPPMLPVEHRLQLATEQLLEPRTLELSGALGSEIDVLVRVESAARQAHLRGRVVDAAGRPIAGATVTVSDRDDSAQKLFGGRSDAAGVFTIRRLRTSTPLPCQVRAVAPGFDETRVEGVAWQRRELELVLQPLLALTVRVVDAGGAPVPDHTLRVGRISLATGMPWHDGELAVHEVRGAADGTFAVTGVRRALHDVHVTPLGDALAASDVERFAVDAAPAHRTVVLQPRVERTLRVVLPDGTPVAGARLELCRPTLGAVDLDTHVVALDRWQFTHVPGKALLLQAGATDENGELHVHGPAATTLVLRVQGPGCLPVVHTIERLDGDGVLVVPARRGGALRVVARPAALLRELDALRSRDRDEPSPAVWLDRPLARGRERVPSRHAGNVAFDADGVGEVRGVPDGTWTPWVEFANECLQLPDVALRDGDMNEVVLDLAPLAPATLRGTVVIDGAPAGPRRVAVERLRGAGERHAGRWMRVDGRGVALDEQGRFELRTLPGALRVLVQRADTGENRNPALTTPGAVEVRAGSTAQQTFTLDFGDVAVRFVDAQQRPVAGVVSWLARPDGYVVVMLPPSGGDGRTRVGGVEAAALQLTTLPRRCGSDRGALARLLTGHPDDPQVLQRTRIELGPVTATRGGPVEAAIVLPDAWFR